MSGSLDMRAFLFMGCPPRQRAMASAPNYHTEPSYPQEHGKRPRSSADPHRTFGGSPVPGCHARPAPRAPTHGPRPSPHWGDSRKPALRYSPLPANGGSGGHSYHGIGLSRRRSFHRHELDDESPEASGGRPAEPPAEDQTAKGPMQSGPCSRNPGTPPRAADIRGQR